MRAVLIPLALTCAALLATGCDRKPEDGPPAPTSPSASAPAPDMTATPSAATVAVQNVELGSAVDSDKRVTQPKAIFAPGDVIYASVITSGSSPASTLRAKWTFEDGQLVSEAEENIAPTGEAVTEFHISKPDGWPVGKYSVEIYVDGTLATTRSFEVQQS